jgi:hypothetical protein
MKKIKKKYLKKYKKIELIWWLTCYPWYKIKIKKT